MTGRERRKLTQIFEKAAAAAAKLRSEAKRLRSRKAGVMALEFALILPLMLTIYFGVVVLSQGLEVGRKVQLLSRTLADLTTQTLPGTSSTGTCAHGTTVSGVDMASVPCLTDTDLTNIFNASTAVLFPFSNVANMTLTEVVFDNVSSNNAACCRARVVWSAGFGANQTLRACGLLTQSANGVNGPADMPAGFYPGGVGDAVTSGQAYVASGNKTDNFIIVADVSYKFAPNFGFEPYQWNQPPNGGSGYTITQTTYMNPRFRSSVTQPATTPPRYDQLIYWQPSGGITSYNFCQVGNAKNKYNVP
jgi:Flp pilus assembly protein TadG